MVAAKRHLAVDVPVLVPEREQGGRAREYQTAVPSLDPSAPIRMRVSMHCFALAGLAAVERV